MKTECSKCEKPAKWAATFDGMVTIVYCDEHRREFESPDVVPTSKFRPVDRSAKYAVKMQRKYRKTSY